MNSFGTRGSKVYVKASYFDNPRSREKYSDFFPFKGDTLLKGKVLLKTMLNQLKLRFWLMKAFQSSNENQL